MPAATPTPTGASSSGGFRWGMQGASSADNLKMGLGATGAVLGGIGAILGAWSRYGVDRLNASMMDAQALATAGSAGGFVLEAREARRLAGLALTTGRDEAEIRSRHLGQQLGAVYSGAASAGIDAKSRTVRDVDRAVRLAASSDFRAIAHNARERSAAYVSQAKGAENSFYAVHAQALMQKAQADYARRMAKVNRNAAFWNGIGALAGTGIGALAGGFTPLGAFAGGSVGNAAANVG